MCNILTSISQKQREIIETKTRWNGSEIALIPKQTQVIQQGNNVRQQYTVSNTRSLGYLWWNICLEGFSYLKNC